MVCIKCGIQNTIFKNDGKEYCKVHFEELFSKGSYNVDLYTNLQ